MRSKLTTVTLAYIDFMSDVGRLLNTKEYVHRLADLFSKDVVTIENGKLILRGHIPLFNRLETVRGHAFPWKIEVLDMVCDEQKNISSVRFTWASEKVGLYVLNAILKVDAQGKIHEVNEVYSKFSEIMH